MNREHKLALLNRRQLLGAALALPLVAARAQTQDVPIVIGMSLGQGAASESRGVRVLAGVTTYIERINATGGVRGRRIELVTLDDDGIASRHVQNVRTLVQRGAVAIVGCVGDEVCQASAAVAGELKVPLVAPLSGIAALSRQKSPYVFRLRADYAREAAALAVQLRNMACFDIALVNEGADDNEAAQALRKAFAEQNLKVDLVRWRPQTRASMDATMAEIGKPGRHAVVLNLSLKSVEALMTDQLSERPEWPRVVTAISTGNPAALLSGFKQKVVAFTSVVPNPEATSKPLAREFNLDADKYGSGYAMTLEGLEGYLGARLVVEALRRIPRDRKLSADTLYDTLETVGTWDLTGHRLSFARGRNSGTDWVDVAVRSRNGALLN